MNTSAALAKIQPAPGAPASAWAARISACWQASVHAILEVGRLLSAAKDALPHGAFETMVESDLPFSTSTAQRLMAVAGDPRLSNPAHVQLLPPSWGTLYELTKLSDEQFEAARTGGIIRPDMMRRDLDQVRQPPARRTLPPSAADRLESHLAANPHLDPCDPSNPGPAGMPVTIDGTATEIFGDIAAPLPNGARAIMSSRVEPDNSLDYFPTPPWATRALCEHILPRYINAPSSTAWEPACGEGHMSEPLREYFKEVYASDIHGYGHGDPGVDFLDPGLSAYTADFIITNPPFGDLTEAFVLRALERARVGVAMFVRLQWLESVGRYEAIFRDNPPTLIAFFAERVPLCKGKYDPDGSTATAYIWLVWRKGLKPQAPFWIPPGQRESLTKPDDVERFTAHPVIKRAPCSDGPMIGTPEAQIQCQPEVTPSSSDDDLEIPAFLKRKEDGSFQNPVGVT